MNRPVAAIVLFIALIAVPLYSQTDETTTSNKLPSDILQAINVTIGGDFIVTGSFTASRLERIDHFVTTVSLEAQRKAVGGLTSLSAVKYVEDDLNKFALRDITLKRSDGKVMKLDLLKYRMTGDLALNPYLRNDDVIIFPTFNPDKNYVDITGAVNKPLKFQYVAGDRLADAITFAGGVNAAYDSVTTAVISRLDNTGTKEDLITVKIADNPPLECGDRISVISEENNRNSYRVRVLGEVQRPGFIYVARNGSPLSEVIEKAGGFTPNADLRNAEIVRDYSASDILRKNLLTNEYFDKDLFLLDPEKVWESYREKKYLEIMRLMSVDEEDSLFFTIDNQLRLLRSGSYVDFTRLTDSASDASRFLVREGDLILIPEQSDYVYVFGGVVKAGFVKYVPGKDYRYYIEQSGGGAEQARGEGNTILIKAKTMTWITDGKDKVPIEPGDYLYLPKNNPRSFWATIQRLSTGLQILGSAATLILLLIQFTK